jgi:3-methyladenine DNA glycosylase/8-oxoguanine DNA glycosylase
MKFTIDPPRGFSFWPTVYSHGWCALPPFRLHHDEGLLRFAVRLSTERTVAVAVRERGGGCIEMELHRGVRLAAAHRRELVSRIRSCLRIDEDLSEFYAEARRYPSYRWIPKKGAGRLLRAPTVFEDVVKMLCTTNCSWALTEVMIGNLCAKLGEAVDSVGHAFPTPDALADVSEKFLRKEIRAGYRAPYLLEFARRVARKDIAPEAWRTSTAPTVELFEELQSVSGIGPYAAGNILKLLGRYDYLGIDSWCRARFCEQHANGRTVTDKRIERFYEPFGRWRGLFFWLDVTKHWYQENFPF